MTQQPEKKHIWQCFGAFCRISALAFGGGYAEIPLLQKELVDRRGWLEEQQITDYYALAQCLPGLIMVNFAVLSMTPRFGKSGGALAALGILLPPVLIVTLIAMFLSDALAAPVMRHALAGMRVAVAALVLWTAWRMIRQAVRGVFSFCLMLAAYLALFCNWLDPALIIVGGALAGLIGGELRDRRAARKGRAL